MTDIVPSGDCGNSPKNQFAERIAVALEASDTEFLSDLLESDFNWEVGSDNLRGPEPVLTRLASVKPPARLIIDRVVTHGKAGAVNGVAEFSRPRRRRRFCHVLTFTNTQCNRLGRITSFSD